MAAGPTDTISALERPLAQEMLASSNIARLAYVAPDGTPRVTPVWFHWNGSEVIVGSERDFKVRAIENNPIVAITIDENDVPYRGLVMRGRAQIDDVGQTVPELRDMAEKYLGPDAGRAYFERASERYSLEARIVIRPTWVRVQDFNDDFKDILG
jgi:PPOX class probable F420-dependent enzyme